uniref:WDR36/Utp21 C-terminal domain-containing protein n=1 Tax=Bigelowiella natans TaxID=227086 RepID=A0A7S2KGV1_BIGNA
MIDWMVFSKAPVSLAFSSRGDFLVTAHTGNVGLFLWANKTYSGHVYLGGGVPSTPHEIDVESLEHTNDPSQSSTVAKQQADADEKDNDDSLFSTIHMKGGVIPKCKGALTLSGLPESRWAHLNSLEMIKERNKPSMPVKAPPEAPFFLNVTSGINPTLNPETLASSLEQEGDSKQRVHGKSGSILPESRLTRLMVTAAAAYKNNNNNNAKDSKGNGSNPREIGDEKSLNSSSESSSSSLSSPFQPVTEFLRGLGPSAIDAEIRNLASDPNTERRDLAAALTYFEAEIKSLRNFEFINAILSLFLKVHHENIMSHKFTLRKKLKAVREVQKETWRAVERQFHYTLCMVNHLSGIQQ